MTTTPWWRTYRQPDWTLKHLITAALADYATRHGGVPARHMFVPLCQVEDSAALVPPGVEVKGNGGVLRGEVFLRDPEPNPEPEPETPAWTQTTLF